MTDSVNELEARRRRARDNAGVVVADDLGSHPGRAARAAGLVQVQPRAWVAATQPVDVDVQLHALQAGSCSGYAVIGSAALWLHGCGPAPAFLDVGVRHGTTLAVQAPVSVRRLSAHVLAGIRTLHGVRVVALEAALLQCAAGTGHRDVVALLEPVLRERRTTVPRLRARLRRGVSGSAAVRRAVDELVGASLERAVRDLLAALQARGVLGLRTEVRFVSAEGASCYADLLDDETATAIEVDGYLSHAVRDRFRADRRRDRWMLAEHAVKTLRVDASEIADDLDALADELAGILRPRRGQQAG